MALRRGIAYPQAIAALRHALAVVNSCLEPSLPQEDVKTLLLSLRDSLTRILARDNGRVR